MPGYNSLAASRSSKDHSPILEQKPLAREQGRPIKSLETTPPKWKRRNVFSMRDFLPIPRGDNPNLSPRRRLQIVAHMNHVADEYAEMTQKEIQLLKDGALHKGTHPHKAAFLLSNERDLKAMFKD